MTGFWGTKFINDKCLKADWVLGLGTRFKEADCSSWYPDYTFNFPPSKLIHIDIEPSEIGRNFPTELGVVADLKAALGVMLKVARRLYPQGLGNPGLAAEIAAYKAEFKASNHAMETSDAFPMMPERILADVRAAMPRDAYLTTDVGWNKNGVGQQFPIYTPGTVLTPGGFATMGFGPPAALGVKIARPDRVVISMVGDGGFGQNPAMLATAAEMNLGVVWVVMNNNAFGTIAGLQKAHYGMTYGTTFPKSADEQLPNYAEIAKAYGVEGIRVRSAAAFRPALEAAIASGKPTLIDVAMVNNPTPTSGHWNILDIYSPDKDVSHVATG
jgi:acetolactate synthase-1/2/3 large subunit